MNLVHAYVNTFVTFFHSIPETFVNFSQQAIVSYLCLNLAITPIFIACQTQLMLSVFSVLFFFINAALLLITLGLEYLGLAVLLVYAGAIIMILLFVIMLVKLQETEEQPFSILAPAKWSSAFVPLQVQHIKTRSIFLITAIILGALLLTYSCKSIVADIHPLTNYAQSNSLHTFAEYSKGVSTSSVLSSKDLNTLPENLVFINTFSSTSEPNHIPWLLKYFSNRLEDKFQPLVLENVNSGIWANLTFLNAPSYNIDKLAFNLAGQFAHLQELLPVFGWSHLLPIGEIHSTGTPLESLAQLVDTSTTIKQWVFYPRTRLGAFTFPTMPVQIMSTNLDIPALYALDGEFKDMFPLPKKDISVISSVLYTLHAPALVLAAICLFIAMVLSFLLTDFKMKS